MDCDSRRHRSMQWQSRGRRRTSRRRRRRRFDQSLASLSLVTSSEEQARLSSFARSSPINRLSVANVFFCSCRSSSSASSLGAIAANGQAPTKSFAVMGNSEHRVRVGRNDVLDHSQQPGRERISLPLFGYSRHGHTTGSIRRGLPGFGLGPPGQNAYESNRYRLHLRKLTLAW
jgi:hypothetical protein